MHISSSYAKILGETNFRTRDFPRSGSKAKKREKEKRRRLNDGDNNGQATHGARKHASRMQILGNMFFLVNRLKLDNQEKPIKFYGITFIHVIFSFFQSTFYNRNHIL